MFFISFRHSITLSRTRFPSACNLCHAQQVSDVDTDGQKMTTGATLIMSEYFCLQSQGRGLGSKGQSGELPLLCHGESFMKEPSHHFLLCLLIMIGSYSLLS